MFRRLSLSRDTLALVLAGGRVDELAALTVHRPKAAMPFGGLYRVIDCVLTNLAASGINRVGILSQYRPLSLMDHVRNGKYWDLSGYRRGLSFLPPHTGETDADWYKGTADALYQNCAFIEHNRRNLTLIVSGDHIYRMDYRGLFDLHMQSQSDLTIAVTPVPETETQRFGQVKVGLDGLVQEYLEKPVKPISNLASMTVYLFNTDVLLSELRQNAKTGKTFQIYDEILPDLVKRGRVSAFIHNGYWAYSRSLEAYFRANMDCLGSKPVVDLEQWELHTNHDIGRIGDHPPLQSGTKSDIKNSIVSPGCIIKGKVINSILSPMVFVDEGSEIVDSVVMEGVRVGTGSIIHRAMLDKYVSIGNNVRLGRKFTHSESDSQTIPGLLECGISVVGKRAKIDDGMVIGCNVLIYPDSQPKHQLGLRVQDGTTVHLEK
ncbi:glucose-1-phosphate adenylyltransferase [bacterium]|nr:glucose-1-phosphate adenylyltransferase [candidate division CSSED10-310 bacterium]